MTEETAKDEGKNGGSAVEIGSEAVGAGCCLLELLAFGAFLGLLAIPVGLLPG